MTPEQFVNGLRSSVVDENSELYQNLFAHTESAIDPYWKRALALFNTLPQEQREVFFEILRQVAVDTTSNILGVLDGVSFLEGDGSGFELMCKEQKLNGDLQSLFLSGEEHRSKILS